MYPVLDVIFKGPVPQPGHGSKIADSGRLASQLAARLPRSNDQIAAASENEKGTLAIQRSTAASRARR